MDVKFEIIKLIPDIKLDENDKKDKKPRKVTKRELFKKDSKKIARRKKTIINL